MPHSMRNIVKVGPEVTRGTAVATTLTMPFMGEGLRPSYQRHLAKIRSSSTFPYVTTHVPLGINHALRFTPEVNVETIRDIFEMALVRDATTKLLTSLTIEESGVGIDPMKYAGCVCSSLEYAFSRSANPDVSAVLAATMEFAAMSGVTVSAPTAGTQGAGGHFQMAKSTFTINSVSALEVLSFRGQRTNALAIGPHDADGNVTYIDDGEVDDSFELVARFATDAWRNIVKNATEHASQFVIATGTANETVTLDIGAGQLESHELGEDSGIVTERISSVAAHTGTVEPVVVTFGSSIGAGVLAID